MANAEDVQTPSIGWVKWYVENLLTEICKGIGAETGEMERRLRDDFAAVVRAEVERLIALRFADKQRSLDHLAARLFSAGSTYPKLTELQRQVKALSEQVSEQATEIRALRSKSRQPRKDEAAEKQYRPRMN